MSESTSELTERAGIATLDESDRHEILRPSRRRHAIEVLAGRAAPVDLDALAVSVAARESGASPRNRDDLKKIAASLHHIHLPKLDAFDLVEYDRSAHTIERCRIRSER